MAGFWISLPLFALSLIGAWISFPAFFGALTGAEPRRGPPPRRAPPPQPLHPPRTPPQAIPIARARLPRRVRAVRGPDWTTMLWGQRVTLRLIHKVSLTL